MIHADEACLGNGTEPPNPGGAGGLIEIAQAGGVDAYDYFIAEPDTTNNRMAIRSASEAFRLLDAAGYRGAPVKFVSDSQYLVKGMREWMRNWIRRGWKRKEGDKLVPVANESLWRELEELTRDWPITWEWVRGHAGHPRNEYANVLATSAAKTQTESGGLVASGFEDWSLIGDRRPATGDR